MKINKVELPDVKIGDRTYKLMHVTIEHDGKVYDLGEVDPAQWSVYPDIRNCIFSKTRDYSAK